MQGVRCFHVLRALEEITTPMQPAHDVVYRSECKSGHLLWRVVNLNVEHKIKNLLPQKTMGKEPVISATAIIAAARITANGRDQEAFQRKD